MVESHKLGGFFSSVQLGSYFLVFFFSFKELFVVEEI